MSQRSRGRFTAAVGRGLWRPNRTSEFVLGIALALLLPWAAVWLTERPRRLRSLPGAPLPGRHRHGNAHRAVGREPRRDDHVGALDHLLRPRAGRPSPGRAHGRPDRGRCLRGPLVRRRLRPVVEGRIPRRRGARAIRRRTAGAGPRRRAHPDGPDLAADAQRRARGRRGRRRHHAEPPIQGAARARVLGRPTDRVRHAVDRPAARRHPIRSHGLPADAIAATRPGRAG